MLQFTLKEILRLTAGVSGAVLLASAVAALPASGHSIAWAAFFAGWMAHFSAALHLSFGLSQLTGTAAATEVMHRLPLTLTLIGPGAVVALIAGAPLGVVLGSGRHIRAAAPLVQVVAAAPVFCAGLLLLWLAQNFLGWQIARYSGQQPWPQTGTTLHAYAAWARILTLPVLTVGAAGAAAVQLALRQAAGSVSDAPFRIHLRMMGLSRWEADFSYLAAPILAGLCISMGDIVLALFSAAAIAEWVFGWPGIAVLFVQSVALADWNVAALVLLIIAALKLFADFCGAIGARLIAPGAVPA